GAKSDRCAASPRVRHRPTPAFPRMRGKEQGLPSHLHARDTPSPARGGGWGWGQGPTAAPQVLASDAAPIPAFPRMRGKEQGGPAASTPVTPPPPLAGEGRGGGEPCPRERKRAPQSAGPRPRA